MYIVAMTPRRQRLVFPCKFTEYISAPLQIKTVREAQGIILTPCSYWSGTPALDYSIYFEYAYRLYVLCFLKFDQTVLICTGRGRRA